MAKVIQIEVPDWVEEEEIRKLISSYVMKELKSLTKDEYIKLLNINLDEIVEYCPEDEVKTLSETREKARERIQW